MKIECQSCQAKYQLDDAKVEGKTKKFGVKCQKCGAVIVVDPTAAQGLGADAGASAPPPPPETMDQGAPDFGAPPDAGGEPAGGDPFSAMDAPDAGGGGGGDPFDFGDVDLNAPPPPPSADADIPDFGDAPAAPPPPPPPPAAEPPAGGGEDPFDFGEPAAPPPPPPPPAGDTGGGDDPFAFGDVDLSGSAPPPPPPAPDAGGGDEFDLGGGGADAGGGFAGASSGDGDFDFGEEGDAGSGLDTGGDDLDDLDRMDAQIEAQAGGAAGGGADDGFFGMDTGSSSSFRLKNARGQVAGPFTIEAVREFATNGKFTGQEEISRNDGPWVSTSVITALSDPGSVNLDQILADASVAAVPGMDGSITFTDDEFGGGKVAGGGGSKSKLLVIVAVVLVVLAVGAGGGWYWWTSIREIPLTELTDAKITELVKSNRSGTGERATLSEQELQKGMAVLDRYSVSEFPAAETAFLTAIQKNPANHRALAGLAWLQAEWAMLLGEPQRVTRAVALANLVRATNPNLIEGSIASSHAYRAKGDAAKAVEFAKAAVAAAENNVEARVALAQAIMMDRVDYDAAVGELKAARSAEPEDQAALLSIGEFFERKEQYDAALQVYQKAIDSRPGNVLPRMRKAELLLQLGRAQEANETLAKIGESETLAKVPALKAMFKVLEARVALGEGRTNDAMDRLKEAESAQAGRADVAVVRGDTLYKTEFFAEALIEYKKARQADPGYMLGHLRYGMTKLYLGDLEEAESAIRKALELDPSSVDAHLEMGKVLAKKEQYSDAQKEFDTVIARDPENALAYAETGRMMAAQGNKSEAIKNFLRAIKLDENNFSIYLTVGEIYAELGELKEATRYTQRSVELAPESIDAKVQLGQLYFQQKDYKKAIQYLSQALESNPRSVNILLDLARAKRGVHDYKGAEEHFKQLREIRAAFAPGRYWFGRNYLDKNENEAAETELSRAVFYDGEDPSAGGRNPEYHYWYGIALRRTNKLGEAQNQFEKAIALKDDYLDPHFALGQVLREAGNTPRAKQEFEKVLEINPRYIPANLELGLIYKEAGSAKKALETFNDIIRIDLNHAEANFRICQIYMDRREYAQAAAKCTRAVRSDPTLCEARMELGNAFDYAGDSRKACVAWKGADACKGLNEYRKQEVQDLISQRCR